METGFHWIDVLLLLFILLSVAAGWQRGFILSVLDLVRWLGSWLAGLFFYKWAAGWLALVTDWTETWRNPIAFLLIAGVVSILIQVVGASFLRRIPKEAQRYRLNRIFGTLPGLANGLIMAAILSALLFALPFSDRLSEAVQQSVVANRLAVFTDEVEQALVPIFDPAIRQTLNRLVTIEPGSDQLVELPFKVEDTRPVPSLEEQMLELVNRERTSRGLKPLAADPELTELARRHSADMFARGYFSHYTPEGIDPFERMKEADVRFRTAGENLALAPTLRVAHTGLMNSPGHRANILDPRFGRVGIGIMDGGRRGLIVSQEFRN
jgi:uncharacterized protein YkwD